MKSDHNDKISVPERALLVMLAEVTDHMMTICRNLTSNPAVAAATRGCDIRRYQDLMSEEDVYCFESYVEANTHKGELFVWSLDIFLTPLGWKFWRSLARQTSDGAQPEKKFEDFTFETFDDLARNYPALMADFEESAKNFDFRL